MTIKRRVSFLIFVVFGAGFSLGQLGAMEQDSIGISGSKKVTAQDVGLPIYPGAQLYKEGPNDDPAIQFGAWGGSSGFKLAVLKLQSDDTADKVVSFYRKALAKYGKVLDCPGKSSAIEDADEKEKLSCGDDRAEKGETVLKSGTKENQHLVGIKQNGRRVVLNLVHVEAHS